MFSSATYPLANNKSFAITKSEGSTYKSISPLVLTLGSSYILDTILPLKYT